MIAYHLNYPTLTFGCGSVAEYRRISAHSGTSRRIPLHRAESTDTNATHCEGANSVQTQAVGETRCLLQHAYRPRAGGFANHRASMGCEGPGHFRFAFRCFARARGGARYVSSSTVAIGGKP
jgi:hypothetical protein